MTFWLGHALENPSRSNQTRVDDPAEVAALATFLRQNLAGLPVGATLFHGVVTIQMLSVRWVTEWRRHGAELTFEQFAAAHLFGMTRQPDERLAATRTYRARGEHT